MNGRQKGMTLVEIVITAGIVAIGLLVVAALVPRVIRQQETNRFRIFACAKALDAMWAFNCLPMPDLVDGESTAGAWDVPVGYRAFTHDPETRLGSLKGGFAPVPTTIARRIDSDRDEIQTLLDDGGQLYYQLAGKAIGLQGYNTGMLREPQETARLVIGFIGPAQHNAMPVLPWKSWPYYAMYPFPPMPDWNSFGQQAFFFERQRRSIGDQRLGHR
jgi:prepilin-type N-terminal cleavage/methylation domain-containing protein